MKRRRANTTHTNVAIFKDISFPRTCPGADYDTTWNGCFHDHNIFAITSCYESAVLFAAREGWIRADAPVCQRSSCIVKQSEKRHVLVVGVVHILLDSYGELYILPL